MHRSIDRSLWLIALLLTILGGRAAHAEPTDRRAKVLGDKHKFSENDLWIYNDLKRAEEEAKRSRRPLLVVFRCVPCDACSEFDQHLLERQEELQPTLEKFVCVRVVFANGLDLASFQFDFDQSFHAVVMRADGVVLARYGTRSPRPEEKDMTVDGFRATLEAALAIEEGMNPQVRDLGKQPLPPRYEFVVPEEFPSLKGKYHENPDYEGKVVQTCIHCHQVRDAERDWHRRRDEAIPDDVLFPQPLPDVLGLTMDARTANTIAAVEEGSLAEQAGLKAGDRLSSVNGQTICSTADLQWALHSLRPSSPAQPTFEQPGNAVAPAVARLTLVFQRPRSAEKRENKSPSGQPDLLEARETTIDLPEKWRRRGDLSWRPTTWDLRRMALGGLVLEEVSENERRDLDLPKDQPALRVKYVGQFGDHARAKQAGFQQGDVIVEVAGKGCPPRETDLIVWALEQPRGKSIPLQVRRGEQTVELLLPTQ